MLKSYNQDEGVLPEYIKKMNSISPDRNEC